MHGRSSHGSSDKVTPRNSALNQALTTRQRGKDPVAWRPAPKPQCSQSQIIHLGPLTGESTEQPNLIVPRTLDTPLSVETLG